MEWILFFILLLFILFNILWYSWRYGITPTPTSSKVRRAVLKALPFSVEGKIVELGSGWGHLTLALAKRYSKHPIDAYEISLIPFLISWLLIRWKKLRWVHLFRKDFFQVSLSDSGLIVCYLYPGAMQRLKEKFTEELKPGTLILTHTFAIPGWTPIQKVYVDDLYHTPVFIYRMD